MFGKVIKGMEVVKKLELVGTAQGEPTKPVKIVDCGETSDTMSQAAAKKEKGNFRKFFPHSITLFFWHLIFFHD